MLRRWLPYLLLVPILGTALFIGGRTGDGRPRTITHRTNSLATEVRCPTCEGLSAAESEAPASVAIRDEIRRRLQAGENDQEVRVFLVSRYGRDILLTPDSGGIAGLVWALPVAAGVLAAGGLAFSLRRRQRQPLRTATAEDRTLVEQALGR